MTAYKVGDHIPALPPEPPVGTVLHLDGDPEEPTTATRHDDGWSIAGHHSRISWRAAMSAWAPFTVITLGKG